MEAKEHASPHREEYGGGPGRAAGDTDDSIQRTLDNKRAGGPSVTALCWGETVCVKMDVGGDGGDVLDGERKREAMGTGN